MMMITTSWIPKFGKHGLKLLFCKLSHLILKEIFQGKSSHFTYEETGAQGVLGILFKIKKQMTGFKSESSLC